MTERAKMTEATVYKGDDRRQFVTFRTKEQEFGADIMSIREIRGWTATTPLPQAPTHVRGVINLRGLVLPVVDLKAQLGCGRLEVTSNHVIIVVHAGGRTIGLLVDGVSDIIDASGSDIQTTPELAQETHGEFAEGIAVLEGRLVTILNMEKLIASLSCGEGKLAGVTQEALHAAA